MRRRTLPGLVLLTCAALAVSAPPAGAHVLVRPDRAPTGALTLFTVLSPDEKAVPLTALRITIPAGLVVSSVADTPGYHTQIVRDQDFRTVAVAWTGGSTAPTHLALFHFAALTPEHQAHLRLSGLQTFADGSTKLWRNVPIEIASASAADTDTASHTEVVAALAFAIGAAIGAAAAFVIAARTRSRVKDGFR